MTDQTLQLALDTTWVVLAGVLVFFMNAGFGLLETGFCRAKNAVNILAKNFTVAAFAGLSFFFVGFGLMFADGNALLGLGGFALEGDAFSSLAWAKVPLEAKFFFQACFAMAAASIVSGAVAERIKFHAYVVFSLFLIALVYAVTGHWIWGGGWLQGLGFWDFAGSTQVHAVGGAAALTGAIILGPRRGKYDKQGRVRPIPGHSMAWRRWAASSSGSAGSVSTPAARWPPIPPRSRTSPRLRFSHRWPASPAR